MSCRWRKAILQYQKGMFPIVLIVCCWQHALTSPSSLALKQGELCSRAGFLYTSRNLRPFLCISPEGLVTQGLWCNVQTPKEDALSLQGDGSGEGPGTAEVERASAFRKGANKNKNNLIDCFSECCKIVNIYMEIWVLNNC